ncbi:MAG: ketopantoate reductase family protein [Longimicrobiales bacterium]
MKARFDGWPRVAVMGAGAVGCYFGGMLARAGVSVTLIGRARHAEAIARDGLLLDSIHFQERVRVVASTSAEAAREADLVFFCVKTVDTEEAARTLAPHLADDAVVISLQNGVDNADRIRALTGIDVVPAVVYVAAEMTVPGHVRHTARGDLVVGATVESRKSKVESGKAGWLVDDIAALFINAGVPCRVSEDIRVDLWTKLVMNCAYNAISALTRAKYGRIVREPATRAMMLQVVAECAAVARAAGVELSEAALASAASGLGEAMNDALSSTAQDVARGKRTEIDSLNGYIARMGDELGVATPVNRTLHALVKLLEPGA